MKVIFVTGGNGLLGREFIQALSGQYLVRNLDLPDFDVTKRFTLSKALWEYGVPDGVVNCAAIDFPPGAEARTFDEVMSVNAGGIAACCEIFGRAMKEKGGGVVVNIASIYGMVSPDHRVYSGGFIKPASYGASKAAVINLTKYYAVLYAPRVRVNCVSLGGIYNNQAAEFVGNYCQRVPLGRMARKDEYNGLIKFLLSDDASYITGANIVADGGYLAL